MPRRKIYFEIFFSKYTKKGSLGYYFPSAKKVEIITVYQKGDCIYLLTRDEEQMIGVFPLLKAISVVKAGSYNYTHCLELKYESSDFVDILQLFSMDISELSDWIGSFSPYSGFGEFYEKYLLTEEIGKGKISVVNCCVRTK